MITPKHFRIATIASLFLLASCDQDPFRRNCPRLHGDYCLERFEGGKAFYLQKIGQIGGGGGILEGTVEQVGWNDHRLLAYVRPLFQGDPPGWYSLDFETGVATKVNDPSAGSVGLRIETGSAMEVWQRLQP